MAPMGVRALVGLYGAMFMYAAGFGLGIAINDRIVTDGEFTRMLVVGLLGAVLTGFSVVWEGRAKA